MTRPGVLLRGDESRELVTVAAGEFAFARGGVPHTFTNRGNAPARYLIVFTPAGFERESAPRRPAGGRRAARLGRCGSCRRPRSAAERRAWIERIGGLLAIDPGGCLVAATGDRIVGFAISQNRGARWCLATYGVVPEHQGAGIGRRLIDATLRYADGRPGLSSSTVHPGATRRDRLAGFDLPPQMRMVGVDLRGAAHGPDHVAMLGALRLLVSRRRGRPGYVYLDDRGRPALLAAARVKTARDLLRAALAASTGPTLVNCITTANAWAVDVGLAARLDLGQEGYLALRGMPVPAPYLPSGHFL